MKDFELVSISPQGFKTNRSTKLYGLGSKKQNSFLHSFAFAQSTEFFIEETDIQEVISEAEPDEFICETKTSCIDECMKGFSYLNNCIAPSNRLGWIFAALCGPLPIPIETFVPTSLLDWSERIISQYSKKVFLHLFAFCFTYSLFGQLACIGSYAAGCVIGCSK